MVCTKLSQYNILIDHRKCSAQISDRIIQVQTANNVQSYLVITKTRNNLASMDWKDCKWYKILTLNGLTNFKLHNTCTAVRFKHVARTLQTVAYSSPTQKYLPCTWLKRFMLHVTFGQKMVPQLHVHVMDLATWEWNQKIERIIGRTKLSCDAQTSNPSWE